MRHVPLMVLLVLPVASVGCAESATAPNPAPVLNTVVAESNRGSTTSETMPVDAVVGVAACPNGAPGEPVHITGFLHLRTHASLNHPTRPTTFMVNPTRVEGVGLNSGNVYVGTGSSHYEGSLDDDDLTLNNFLLVGKGSATNYRVHYRIHSTTNANGVVTSEFEVDRVTCK